MLKYLVPEALILLLLIYLSLVWYFRKNKTAERIVAEVLGDNTAEAALRDYQLARERLERHLESEDLSDEMVERIEQVLGLKTSSDEPTV